MKRKLAVAAIAVLVAFVAVGCGDDDKGAADDKPVTKAAFITSAEAICTKHATGLRAAAAKLREKGTKSDTLPNQDVLNFLKGTSLPAYDDLVRQLGALAPPKGEEATIDRILAALASAIDTVKANPEKYVARDVEDPFDEFNRRATAYGMKVCGS